MKYFDWLAVKKIIDETANKNDLWRIVCKCEAGKVTKISQGGLSSLDGVTKFLDWTQMYIDFQGILNDDFWGTMTLAGVRHTLLIFETSRVEKP